MLPVAGPVVVAAITGTAAIEVASAPVVTGAGEAATEAAVRAAESQQTAAVTEPGGDTSHAENWHCQRCGVLTASRDRRRQQQQYRRMADRRNHVAGVPSATRRGHIRLRDEKRVVVAVVEPIACIDWTSDLMIHAHHDFRGKRHRAAVARRTPCDERHVGLV